MKALCSEASSGVKLGAELNSIVCVTRRKYMTRTALGAHKGHKLELSLHFGGLALLVSKSNCISLRTPVWNRDGYQRSPSSLSLIIQFSSCSLCLLSWTLLSLTGS